jgi:hypothetical protein
MAWQHAASVTERHWMLARRLVSNCSRVPSFVRFFDAQIVQLG